MSDQTRQRLIYGVLGVVVLLAIWVLLPSGEDWEEMIANGDLEQRLKAIGHIQSENTQEAAAILQLYVQDKEDLIAQRTLLALGRMTHADKVVLNAALQDERSIVREAAVSSLASHDPGTLRQILKEQKETPEIRAACASNLGSKRDWDSVPNLILGMDDPDEGVRAASANAVRHIMGVKKFGDYSVSGDPAKRRTFVRWLYENHHGFKDVHDGFDKYLDMRDEREKG